MVSFHDMVQMNGDLGLAEVEGVAVADVGRRMLQSVTEQDPRGGRECGEEEVREQRVG